MKEAIINALRQKPPTGSGMVDKAAKDMQAVPGYREYQMQKMSAGEQPVTLEQFMRGRR